MEELLIRVEETAQGIRMESQIGPDVNYRLRYFAFFFKTLIKNKGLKFLNKTKTVRGKKRNIEKGG